MVRSFVHGAMGHRSILRGRLIELFHVPATTGVTKAVICAVLSVGWCI